MNTRLALRNVLRASDQQEAHMRDALSQPPSPIASGLPCRRVVGVGRRAPSAIGRRAGGFRPPGFGAEVGTALRKAEGREARVSAVLTRRKNVDWNSASLIRILYMYMGWGSLESGARGGRPSPPSPRAGPA